MARQILEGLPVEIRCAECGFHACTADNEASNDKGFLAVAYLVMNRHTKATRHVYWNFEAGK